MNNVAFIFARGGSKGIKNKNIAKFNGKPLITHTIESALHSKLFKDIVVSTDDVKISEISKSSGALVLPRPIELATDDSNEFLSWKHAVNSYNKTFDNFISLPCTSPLRNFITINNMINIYKRTQCDLLLGVTQSNHIPNFNMVKLNEQGKVCEYETSANKIFRRQDALNCYNITTYAYITSPEYIINADDLMGGNIYGHILSKQESIDIDDIFDFKFAEYLYTNKIDLDEEE